MSIFRTRLEMNLGLGFWMAVSSGDINNDGRSDLFSSNFGTDVEQPHKLFKLKRNGKYRSVESQFNLAKLAPDFGWGSTFEDLNNDGWVDLFFAGNFPFPGPILNNPGYLLTNNLHGSFRVEGLDPSILTGKFSKRSKPVVILTTTVMLISSLAMPDSLMFLLSPPHFKSACPLC